MKIISTPRMPEANGHYSHCIRHKGLLYLSGQLPVDPKGNVPESIEEQTEIVLRKIEHILGEAGTTRLDILQVRIYLTDNAHWEAVNNKYGAFMGEHKPVRCIVTVKDLHFGSAIEIEVIAKAKKKLKL